MRTLLPFVIALLVALGGCGDGDGSRAAAGPPGARLDTDNDGVPDARDAAPEDAAIGAEKAVRAEVDLKQTTGPPDAGTVGGHRGGATASTRTATLTVSGTVQPATARVSARDDRSERRTHARVDDHGEFQLTLRGLRRGRNRFTLEGRAAGYDSWRLALTVTRR